VNDVELLEHHRNGDEQAFAELVRRHIGWVFGVARRRVGDAHLAEDVAQAVFVLLHRKLPKFPSDAAMMSWLHRTARYATDVAVRSEKRRRRHETEAAMMHAQSIDPDPNSEWAELAPLLDELIGRLNRTDREAVLLRYFRGMSFAEVGDALGSSEEAARKRVDRAIARLREFATRRGVATVTSASLAVGLSQHVAPTAPSGLVATSTGAATAPAGSALATSISPITQGTLTMMRIAALKSVAAVVVVGVFIVGGTYAVVRPTSKPSTQQHKGLTRDYPKLAPYNSIRWRDATPEVRLDDTWYELVSIDDQSDSAIVDFAKEHYNKIWQKRFEEDLVQVMSEMGHEPGDTVKLVLKNLETSEQVTKDKVPMTHENRQQIWREAQARESKQ
jgi:RNA polymerase sigma factor (sigma-70 family)